ncbi:MAG: SDR family oxidoreductase [Candidatus Heimdallarchaeota archaeon]|nr:SDR family oxidoreductase [Candidatus Heimdallarchaeota archaeon]MCK4955630.1 SDR family oxidoreductase [Candidatus Heimdallarchaeota archaeon]
MKTILITGASRGLGLEFTRQYIERGDKVIATCRKPEKARELQELQSKFLSKLSLIQMDVAEEEDRNRAYEQIEREFGVLDVLINNAGIISGNEKKSYSLGEIYKEDFNKVFLVNSIAPLLISEKFLPMLEKGNEAKILNITSDNSSIAKRSVGGKYSYCTSKAALNMITKILSNDLLEKGIIVLAIHPGWLRTDMGGSTAPLEKEKPISMIIDLIEKVEISDTGKFLSWEGEEIPW